MDVAFELTPLVACKLIVYSFGALVHLFLMVLILGQRRLRRLEWLIFWLIAALFMWNSGNLLALNVGLFYGRRPAFLSGVSQAIAFLGLIMTAPLLVDVHSEYVAQFQVARISQKLLVSLFYLPLAGAPWMLGRLLGNLQLNSLVALGPLARPVAVWLVASLAVGTAFNLSILREKLTESSRVARFHGWLAGVQAFLVVGLAWTVLFRPIPIRGLSGYFPTFLALLAVVPGGLLVYWIFRYNFLNFRVQRNLVFSVVAIFTGLIYLNFMRRLSGYLEMREILPSAVTEAVMIFLLVVFLEPVKKVIKRALHAAFVSEFERVQKFSAEIQDYAKQTGDVEGLARFVEVRAPAVFGLKQVVLRLAGKGDQREETSERPGKLHSFRIARGGGFIGTLDVIPATPELSGDQFGAMQLLADQMAAAVELCQLITAKVQLERALAEKAKMAFLGEMAARIAHNVKNPLSSMKTLVQLLEENSSLPERVREDCRLVTNEIDRLNVNISQVLRYAKPARDTNRAVDLAAVARRVLALARADAERREVRLEFESAPGPCLVRGGEEGASDIVSNLVVNALEASPPGGSVRIRLAPEDSTTDWVELSVEDQGPGIPQELRAKIFQPFFTTRPGGTGLGLAIVARRAEEIGGVVEYLTPPGSECGAQFRVRFQAALSTASARGEETYALRPDRG